MVDLRDFGQDIKAMQAEIERLRADNAGLMEELARWMLARCSCIESQVEQEKREVSDE